MFSSMSKSLLVVAALAATLPAAAATFSFSAVLSGANEFPSNASTATGNTLVTFDDVASTVTVSVTFAGLSSAATAAHIHCCAAPGANSGVAMGMTGFPSSTGTTYNAVLSVFSGGNTFASVLAGAQAGLTYVNVHNAIFQGGEIRGNLAPVPEASTYAMMLAGLAAFGALARRRQSRG